jgi:hypothetical protein
VVVILLSLAQNLPLLLNAGTGFHAIKLNTIFLKISQAGLDLKRVLETEIQTRFMRASIHN